MTKNILFEDSLYIEPISACNLRCQLCYAKTRSGKETKILPRETIDRFIKGFFKIKGKLRIYWCGTGEIFLYPEFPMLINDLTEKYGANRITHSIQTNATMIDLLDQIKTLRNVELIASIDAPKKHHDWNRGKGAYDRAVEFCKLAIQKRVKKIDVRCLITRDNVLKLKEAEKQLIKDIGCKVGFYITKPVSNVDLKFFQNHQYVVNRIRDTSKLLREEKLNEILKKKYHNKYKEMFVNSYLELSLLYDGVYNCCDGIIKIGTHQEAPEILLKKFKNSLVLCKQKCPWFKDCFGS